MRRQSFSFVLIGTSGLYDILAGMMAAMFAPWFWLTAATIMGFAVSTTHSIGKCLCLRASPFRAGVLHIIWWLRANIRMLRAGKKVTAGDGPPRPSCVCTRLLICAACLLNLLRSRGHARHGPGCRWQRCRELEQATRRVPLPQRLHTHCKLHLRSGIFSESYAQWDELCIIRVTVTSNSFVISGGLLSFLRVCAVYGICARRLSLGSWLLFSRVLSPLSCTLTQGQSPRYL